MVSVIFRKISVSIHAPAWGATLIKEKCAELGCVSIHAPAWGATIPVSHCHYLSRNVSIHAPAWGATGRLRSLYDLQAVSIHAPAWGATVEQGGLICRADLFQSTPPRGGRLMLSPRSQRVWCGFNPRPRVGGDEWGSNAMGTAARVSIHAPAWGATRATGQRRLELLEVSIHAPAWGATEYPGR